MNTTQKAIEMAKEKATIRSHNATDKDYFFFNQEDLDQLITDIVKMVGEAERRMICQNHLETLEDALEDSDLHGAINGMVYGLRTFLTPTPDKQ